MLRRVLSPSSPLARLRGIRRSRINIPEQKVTFEGDVAVARKVLARLGYPQAGSPEAQSILEKGHSLVSCAIGRLS